VERGELVRRSRIAVRRVDGLIVAVALFVGARGSLFAQSAVAEEPAAARSASERPGLIRLGRLYLTPYIHIGTLGIDTNVFYTPTDRHADFTASGGPGLEIVRPLGKASRLRLDGGLDYLYFARTPSQRKLNGHGSASLELGGVKTSLAVEERYERSYSRPSYEVDARVQQESEGTRALIRRRLSERFSLSLFGDRTRRRTDTQAYLGTDLGQTLTQDTYRAGGELLIALTIKTRLVGGGEQSWYRFPRLQERQGQSTLAYGGLRTDATALISGQALAGMRWFRLESGGERRGVYAEVDATWNISPKTKLGGRYSRDIRYSAFGTTGATPTNALETAELFLDKVLVRGVYVRIFGRAGRFVSDGDVTLAMPGEAEQSTVRDDRVYEGGGELGYQFRSRFRIGLSARYTNRRSTFETFGVRGLLAGLTVQYNPPQPSFRR
jgi:hypothetical protein